MLTTVIGHATGDLFPAADWNTYVRDNLNWLIQPGGGISVDGFNTLTVTNHFHFVSGGGSCNTITADSPVVGQQVRFLCTDPTTFDASGGNIDALGDYNAYPGEIVLFTFGGTHWKLSTQRIGYSSKFDITNDTTLQTIFSQAIPGGLLGLNGALRIGIGAAYRNLSGGTRTLIVQISYGGTLLWGDEASIVNVASHYGFYLDALLSNENATNSQRLAGAARLSGHVAGSVAGTGQLSGLADTISAAFEGEAAEDSTVDQNLVVQVKHSTADPNLWIRGTAHVLYQP